MADAPRQRAFATLDVFTARRFAGNPLAVVIDGDGLSETAMQTIAREFNLSETVFIQPARDEGERAFLRIFTPGMELPMAGHPVVGTWNMLVRLGVVAAPASGTGRVTIQQEIKLGILPVEIDFVDNQPVKVTMTQGTPSVGEPLDDVPRSIRRTVVDDEEFELSVGLAEHRRDRRLEVGPAVVRRHHD